MNKAILFSTLLLFFAFKAQVFAEDTRRQALDKANQAEKLAQEALKLATEAKQLAQQSAPPLPPHPPLKTSYLIGLGQFTANPLINSESGANLVQEVAHIEYIQNNWKESKTADGTGIVAILKPDVDAARKAGLKVYISLELLSYDRKQIVLPPGLTGDFNSPTVRESYLKTVKEIATQLQPDYFIMNIEVNLYKAVNSKDYQAFVSLYKQAYPEVKKLNPNGLVAVSLAYNDFNNKNCYDAPDLEQVKADAADFAGSLDMLAISTYPFCFFNPSAMPENFLEKLANISSLPLFISETGWVSEGFKLGGTANGYPFPGSQDAQAKYIERFSQLADYAVKKGKHLVAVNYIALIDPNKEFCDAIVALDPSIIWYCSLATRDGANKPKKSFEAMKKWKNRLESKR